MRGKTWHSNPMRRLPEAARGVSEEPMKGEIVKAYAFLARERRTRDLSAVLGHAPGAACACYHCGAVGPAGPDYKAGWSVGHWATEDPRFFCPKLACRLAQALAVADDTNATREETR